MLSSAVLYLSVSIILLIPLGAEGVYVEDCYTTTLESDDDVTTSLTSYKKTSECVWSIEAPTGNRILLEMVYVEPELKRYRGCVFLEVLDETERSANSTGRFCGWEGVSLISRSNKLHIRFSSEEDTEAEFLLTLEFLSLSPKLTCNTTTEVESGTLSSPNYPRQYSGNVKCLYSIQAPVDKRIKLEFEDFRLEEGACSDDFLTVYDGWNTVSVKNVTSCEDWAPLQLISSSSSLLLYFHTSAVGSDKGFRITYSFLDSNDGLDGIVVFPPRPCSNTTVTSSDDVTLSVRRYSIQSVCELKIEAPPYSRILLGVNYIEPEKSGRNGCVHLEVFDGAVQSSASTGQFCGRKNVGLFSQTNNLTIRFSSRTPISDAGFNFTVSFENQTSRLECNDTTEAEPGTVSSPDYPKDYPNSVSCYYSIHAPANKTIKLEFEDFRLEEGSCSDDVLTVFDGKSTVSPQLGTFCGTKGPQYITSSTSSVLLYFRSNDNVRDRGFNLTYEFAESSDNDGSVVYPPIEPCNNTTVTTSGIIEYGWFEDGYYNDSSCYWTVTAKSNYRILLVSNYTVLENSFECQYDFIEVFDGELHQNSSVGKFCGRTDVRLISETNSLYIHFLSDHFLGRGGFQFHVSFIPESSSTSCNRTSVSNSGIILSPNYPGRYPHNTTCLYGIQAPDNSAVQLEFREFALERGECSEDYITIYDGLSSASKEIGTFCGRDVPLTIISSSSRMMLYFHANGFLSEKGFNLTYQFVDANNSDVNVIYGDPPSEHDPDCSSTITVEEINLTSPRLEGDYYYQQKKKCRTNIRAPIGYGVDLHILWLDLEKALDCISDYVNVTYQLEDGQFRTIRLCGYHIPNSLCFHSETNNLTVDFKSDESFEGSGYEIDYSFISPSENSSCISETCEGSCQGYCYNNGDGYHCACPDGKVPPECDENITWTEISNDTVHATKGDNVTLTCKVNHPYTITNWEFWDSKDLPFDLPFNNRQRLSEEDTEVHLTDVRTEDSGEYTCIVLAGDLHISRTVTLSVEEKRVTGLLIGLPNESDSK